MHDMSYPIPRLRMSRPWGYGIRYDHGGWRRPRCITFTVDREGLLRMYRNALRRCGRDDGWTHDIEVEVAAGSYSASFEIPGVANCKHFAEELDEMGLHESAANVDAFAWAPEVSAAEDRHATELERMTSL